MVVVTGGGHTALGLEATRVLESPQAQDSVPTPIPARVRLVQNISRAKCEKFCTELPITSAA